MSAFYASLWKTIQATHYSQKPFLGLLGRLLSWGYRQGLGVAQNAALRKLREASPWPCPVISIGNLTTGGTGKTPVTIAIAQYLTEKGLKTTILSRGYKAKYPLFGQPVLSPDNGDEAYLMSRLLPKSIVRVGKDRVLSGKKALLAEKPDVMILDDAFQAVSCPRSLNIVLVDGDVGFGNGHLLPAGPMREPLSAISRADVVLLTKSIRPDIRCLVEAACRETGKDIPVLDCPFVSSWQAPILGDTEKVAPETLLEAKRVLAVCGIAQPAAFRAQVATLFPKAILDSRVFPDHHVYSDETIARLQSELQADAEAILVTTYKDWVKLDSQKGSWPTNRVFVLDRVPQCDWSRVLAPLVPALEAV